MITYLEGEAIFQLNIRSHSDCCYSYSPSTIESEGWMISFELAAVDAGGITKNKTQTKAQVHHVRVCAAAVENVPPLTVGGGNCCNVNGWRQHRGQNLLFRECVLCVYNTLACRTYRHNTSSPFFSHFLYFLHRFPSNGGDVIRISVGNCRPHEVVNNGTTRDRVL